MLLDNLLHSCLETGQDPAAEIALGQHSRSIEAAYESAWEEFNRQRSDGEKQATSVVLRSEHCRFQVTEEVEKGFYHSTYNVIQSELKTMLCVGIEEMADV